MSNILVVGATRGLGAALARHYVSAKDKVYGTTRSDHAGPISEVEWIKNIDVSKEAAGVSIAQSLKGKTLDIVIVTAGVFGKESFDEPNFEEQTKMYTTSAIAPVFVVHYLVKAGNLKAGSKIILVSSEAGSISLRHSSEGGGNYAHHASKAALNMVGKLLSFDLAEQKIAVGLVHPGFMRTEMTKGVGYDEFWDEGGGKYKPCQLIKCSSNSRIS